MNLIERQLVADLLELVGDQETTARVVERLKQRPGLLITGGEFHEVLETQWNDQGDWTVYTVEYETEDDEEGEGNV